MLYTRRVTATSRDVHTHLLYSCDISWVLYTVRVRTSGVRSHLRHPSAAVSAAINSVNSINTDYTRLSTRRTRRRSPPRTLSVRYLADGSPAIDLGPSISSSDRRPTFGAGRGVGALKHPPNEYTITPLYLTRSTYESNDSARRAHRFPSKVPHDFVYNRQTYKTPVRK